MAKNARNSIIPKPYHWHCPNCGAFVSCIMNENGELIVQCSHCGAKIKRVIHGRRHDTFYVETARPM